MLNRIYVKLQHVIPQHALSSFGGWLAGSRKVWLKNRLIRFFLSLYHVDMSLAIEQDPYAYASYNDFFTRRLLADKRPIIADSHAVACPVDGTIAEIGRIQGQRLLQVKKMYFDLQTLCGNDANLSQTFNNGDYATLYLAPHNYHRVHMPLDGVLVQTIYVPGKLFAVNRITTELIPNLYSRNERLICIFETAIGKMAVILVGAMIVGSIDTVWMRKSIRSKQIEVMHYDQPSAITLKKGAELGLFKLGSTVIMLFEANRIHWLANQQAGMTTRYGEAIATIV